MVRTFPNHFLLGSTRAASVGLSCNLANLGIFWSYILSRFMVFLVLKVFPVPEVLPFMTLSGLVAALDLLLCWNLECKFLLLALIPLSYFAIVENYKY